MARHRKQEEFEPEIVGEGVSRVMPVENPNDALPEPSIKGGWKKCTYDELVKYENEKLIVGFKPDTMEILLKGEL